MSTTRNSNSFWSLYNFMEWQRLLLTAVFAVFTFAFGFFDDLIIEISFPPETLSFALAFLLIGVVLTQNVVSSTLIGLSYAISYHSVANNSIVVASALIPFGLVTAIVTGYLSTVKLKAKTLNILLMLLTLVAAIVFSYFSYIAYDHSDAFTGSANLAKGGLINDLPIYDLVAIVGVFVAMIFLYFFFVKQSTMISYGAARNFQWIGSFIIIGSALAYYIALYVSKHAFSQEALSGIIGSTDVIFIRDSYLGSESIDIAVTAGLVSVFHLTIIVLLGMTVGTLFFIYGKGGGTMGASSMGESAVGIGPFIGILSTIIFFANPGRYYVSRDAEFKLTYAALYPLLTTFWFYASINIAIAMFGLWLISVVLDKHSEID
ncbi:MAG: hypothetical protein ACTSYA_11830 [Candidatus Kariarchaeaceae archaeon]